MGKRTITHILVMIVRLPNTPDHREAIAVSHSISLLEGRISNLPKIRYVTYTVETIEFLE